MQIFSRDNGRLPNPDPLSLSTRLLTKLRTLWLDLTFPFNEFGPGVSIHYSCEIPRHMSPKIAIGRNVFLGRDIWLNVEANPLQQGPAIIFGDGCKIGRRCVISAKNEICLEDDVLFGPSVLVMDHNHEYSDPQRPIHGQGTTGGGRVTIGRNSWIGYGAVICCSKGELCLGRNCVVGANSVVTRSFDSYSVIAGNPAELVKRYDPVLATWVRV